MRFTFGVTYCEVHAIFDVVLHRKCIWHFPVDLESLYRSIVTGKKKKISDNKMETLILSNERSERQ